MKNKKIYIKIIAISILVLFVVAIFTNKSTLQPPFSPLSFNSTLDDMFMVEGDDYDSYDSVYFGTTYVYAKKYLNQDGNVKYMYDDKENLRSIAWTYSSDNNYDIEEVFSVIKSELTKNFGDSEYSPNAMSNKGDVWYKDGGSIGLSAVLTPTQHALQYSYTIKYDDIISQ